MPRFALQRVSTRKLMVDSEFIASQSIVPNLPELVFRQFAGQSGMALFTSWKGGFDKAGIGLTESPTSKEIFTWRIKETEVAHPRVVTSSAVPSTPIQAGVDFTFEIDKSHFKLGSTFLLRDQRTVIMLVGKGTPSGSRVSVTAQVVGVSDPSITFSVKPLLEEDVALKPIVMKVGEASTEGQEYETPGFMDFFQPATAFRSEITATGHGMSMDTSSVWAAVATDGSGKTAPLLALAYDDTLNNHMKSFHYDIFYGRANWDPRTGKFANRIGTGPRADRPSSAGLLEQFESSTMPTMSWSPSTETVAQLHDKLLASVSHLQETWKLPDTTTYLLLTRGAGKRVLNDIFAYANTLNQIQLQRQQADENVKVGLLFKEYVTTMGVLVPYDMGWGDSKFDEFDRFDYKGTSFNVRDADIFVVPVVSNSADTNLARPNIRICPRQSADGKINRGLVFGVMPGMTGFGNGLARKILQEQEALTQNLISLRDQYKLGSPVDGEVGMFLSHYTTVCENPDLVLKIEHRYQPQWA